MKKYILKIFYFILIVYLLESFLLLFDQNNFLSKDDLKKKRVELALQKNIEFDQRDPSEAFLDFIKNNQDLKSKFNYSPIFRFSEVFQNARNKNEIIPFRGPINSKTMSCNEEGYYHLDNSDKYGFKNYNSIYDNQINTMLLGDSLAEGNCQDIENDVAGNLTKKGFNTANFGVTGSSLLVALGIIREFGDVIKPKNYVYLYSESNDLEGLNWSKKDNHLMNYLNDNYTVNYIERYKEISSFLDLIHNETIQKLEFEQKNSQENIKPSFVIFKENLIDILELKRTKEFVRYKILKKKSIDLDLNLFFLIIEKLNQETRKNKGNFIFVYVPTSAKYFLKNKQISPKIIYQIQQKRKILKGLNSMGISVIDLGEFFDNISSVNSYFSLGYFGHFNANGYNKIAEIISNKLE